jgi:hypothetical protein
VFRGLILVLLCSAWPAGAHAQASLRPALHWSRGSGAQTCIDPRALALQVEVLTGPVLVEATRADLSIEGHIERASDGKFAARIVATKADGTQGGERTLSQVGDCRALDGSLAFVIAMLINPDLALDKLPASLVELGAEGPAPEQVLLDELERTPPAPYAPPTRAPQKALELHSGSEQEAEARKNALHLGVTASTGEFPGPSLGGYLGYARWARRWLGVEVQARFAVPLSTHQLDAVRFVEMRAFGGLASLCPRAPLSDALFIDACVGVELMLTQAVGHGFASPRTAQLMSYAGQLAAGLTYEIGAHVALRMRGFVRTLFNRAELTYAQAEQTSQAFALRRVAAGASFGLAYAF